MSFKKIFVFASLFIVLSCDSLLDIETDNNFTVQDFSDAENIERALIGAYFGFGGIAGGELFGGDFNLISTLISQRTDIGWLINQGGADYEGFVNHDISKLNPIVAANWARAYDVINLTNNILANIENIEEETLRNRINGEALAIRGILYFEMVRLWAPQYSASNLSSPAIPITLNPVQNLEDINTPTRSTVGEVYARAENDLTMASSLLQSFGKNGINISYFACQSFLARLNLQKGDFDAALIHSNNVINSNEFILLNSPLDAFNNPTNTSEDIFAIQQTFANNSGDRTTGVGITTFVSSITESGLGVLGLIDANLTTNSPSFTGPKYSAIDRRAQIDLDILPSTTTEEINTGLYRNPINTGFLTSSKYIRADHVIPIIRLAEIHLIRAEALIENNPATINSTALLDLNLIRERSGLQGLEMTDFVSPEAFYDSIVVERKRELFIEGHLLHDLRRTRMFRDDSNIVIGFENGVGTNPLDTDLILPIPQEETDASGID